MGAETPGQRLYLIRLACGDGVREPEIMKTFAARIKRETKATYHPTTISLLERDIQGWRIEDAETLARVDPLTRGRIWLAFGVLVEEHDTKLSATEIEQARRDTDLTEKRKKRGGR